MDGADHGAAYGGPLADLGTGPANVLLLAPAHAPGSSGICVDLLASVDPPANALLLVSMAGRPDAALNAWRGRTGGLPSTTAVVTLNEQARSMTADADVRTIGSPADLTGLGIAITGFLDEHAAATERFVVCVRALTTLLQYADLKRVYRLLHVLTRQLSAAGTLAHFHLDPAAHDDATVNTLATLFDGLVEVDESGDMRVQTR